MASRRAVAREASTDRRRTRDAEKNANNHPTSESETNALRWGVPAVIHRDGIARPVPVVVVALLLRFGAPPIRSRRERHGAQVLGTPTREEIRAMNPNYTEFKFPQIRAHPWTKVFRSRTPPDAIDAVARMLAYSPDARVLPLDALTYATHARTSSTRPCARRLLVFVVRPPTPNS